MESKAKLAGHPAHPILIVFPLGLLATVVIFDGFYFVNDSREMALVSYWLITVGVLAGVVAAVPGWIDWFAVPAYTRAKRIEIIHGIGNVVVLLLFGASWLWRTNQPGYQPPALALISGALAFLLLGLTGWLTMRPSMEGGSKNSANGSLATRSNAGSERIWPSMSTVNTSAPSSSTLCRLAGSC